MLSQIAERVHSHQSDFLQTNAVVVQGRTGVLVIDPGITRDELTCLATDIRELGQPVVAGFATHPHFDHVLWHPELGDAPRYGTAPCAADMEDLLAKANWKDLVAEVLPPDIAGDIPLDMFGVITGLPPGAAEIAWDGPRVRIIEHRAHAAGHAALLIEDSGVLVAGDMVSDVLMPFLDLEAADPLDDYLEALRLFDGVADGVQAVVPGHGSVGPADQLSARIALDRAYVEAVRDGRDPHDPRLAPSAPHAAWLPGVDEWQRGQVVKASPGTLDAD